MLSGILVKVIGAFFSIPLANLYGADGNDIFISAYYVYTAMYVISSAGLPVAVSKMISEAKALGRGGEVRRIARVTFLTFLIMGTVLSLTMILLVDEICLFIGGSCRYAILTVAPTIFFTCIVSAVRGYFQGLSNMIPTAVSQIIEALGKLIFGLGLAWYLMGAGYPLASEVDVYATTNRADVGYITGYVNHRGQFSKIKGETELAKGEVSFDLVARFYSQDPTTRTNGGQMADPMSGSSYFEVDQLKPQDYEAIKNLKEGEISVPVESLDNEGRSGNTVYKIIKVDKIIPSHTATFTQDYNMLLDQAKQQKSQEAIDRFMEEKIKSTYIIIDPMFKDCTFEREGWAEKFRK